MIINHIGLSGGKDSTALLGWAIHESGYPRESIVCSFCDTGNEYKEVYDQIEKLSNYCIEHGVRPVITLRANDSRWTWNTWPLFLALAIWKKRFPSARARFCTEHLKIIPTKHFIESLQLEGHDIVAHSGVRASESKERAMMEEWSDGQFNCRVRRPLLKHSVQNIWEMHRKYRLPINALYFKGRKRVGCRLCCMSNKQDIRTTAKVFPWVIDLYAMWEVLFTKISDRTISTFFPAGTVPAHFRSIKGLVRRRDSKRGRKGNIYSVATIYDVVNWAGTLRGGKQLGFDFAYEENFDEDDAHMPCASGYCE